MLNLGASGSMVVGSMAAGSVAAGGLDIAKVGDDCVYGRMSG